MENETKWHIVWGTNNLGSVVPKEGKDAFYVSRWADGCISIKLPWDYIYAGEQPERLVEALQLSIKMDKDEKAKNRKRFENNFDRDYGDRVDLNLIQTRVVLDNPKARIKITEKYATPEIYYNDKWLVLGGTDLIDDIKTTTCFNLDEDLESMIEAYRSQINFGARVTDTGFFVVTSLTDG